LLLFKDFLLELNDPPQQSLDLDDPYLNLYQINMLLSFLEYTEVAGRLAFEDFGFEDFDNLDDFIIDDIDDELKRASGTYDDLEQIAKFNETEMQKFLDSWIQGNYTYKAITEIKQVLATSIGSDGSRISEKLVDLATIETIFSQLYVS
jgi:hypothetical protein